ncbi:MAG: alpha-glucosidase, partial [Gammaproteobacteria bacterium]|nr:alpha-glucosidase [Gammaproteobacteria bacterium]
MNFKYAAIISALGIPAMACAASPECAQSPGHVINLCVAVREGHATFEVSRLGKPVLAPSNLGLDFVGEPEAHYSAI